MLSLFLILEQNYKSIVIWTLRALYTLLIVCNGHSLVYTFIIQSLFSHHIIVKVISESIFIILGTWGREGLPLGCLMLQSIFQKKRHFSAWSSSGGIRMMSRIGFGFLPSREMFSCSLFWSFCVSCLQPGGVCDKCPVCPSYAGPPCQSPQLPPARVRDYPILICSSWFLWQLS